MGKTIGILQPGYLPWLGFFEQLCRSDVFVLLDDVQFDKNGWRNRNRIKTSSGSQWLTVPVITSRRFGQKLKDVKIDNNIRWPKKHLNSITQNYIKAPYFSEYYPGLEKILSKTWEYLIDLDISVIEWLSRKLDIRTKKIISSSLSIKGDRIGRLIELCKYFGADVFYEGQSGKNYIDDIAFTEHGIEVRYQDYAHPVYSQLYGDFVSHLSVIDLLFNCGAKSKDIITGKQN